MEGERPILEVRDLTVSFGAAGDSRENAITGVSLSVFANQTLAVVGESGSGKSVTASSIMGLLPRPTARVVSGEVIFRKAHATSDARGDNGSDSSADFTDDSTNDASGVDLLKLTDRQMRTYRGRDIAMIFQEPMTSLNPVFTVGDQVAEAIVTHRHVGKREAMSLAEAALKEAGIVDASARLSVYPHELSGGLRQRVMIAMALACRSSVLLADEPTTALDVTVQAQILDLISSVQRERGLGVIFITHSLGVVARVADVVCVMFAGRVVEYAAAEKVLRSPRHPYTRALLACAPRLRDRVERLATVADLAGDSDRVVAFADGGAGRAWWRAEPGEQESAYALCEVAAQHWVGLEAASCPANMAAKSPAWPVVVNRRLHRVAVAR